ncbi:MAG: GGDEF domain-containing protein [Nitrospinaceae bacterium]
MIIQAMAAKIEPATINYPDHHSAEHIRRLVLICLLWGAVVFAIDLSAPSDIAVAVPYIGLVLMGLWLPQTFYIQAAALGATLLTLLGLLNSAQTDFSWVGLSNRLIALFSIWATAILCILFKRNEGELKKAHGILERRVQELKDLKEKFSIIAQTDPLTELPNRRGMMEKLEIENFRFKRNKKPFSVIMADIDFFKKINDTFGHDAGDQILIQISKIISESSRKTDVVCRWGGEEFLTLLPETDLEGAFIWAEKLRSQIESHCFRYNQYNIPVTMSFGASVFNREGLDLDACIKQADENLYHAKETGKNKVVAEFSREPQPVNSSG